MGFVEFLFGSFIGILVFLLLLILYFLPTIIAVLRHHRNALAIFLLNFFKHQGCRIVQGYLFSKPVEADALLEMLRAQTVTGTFTIASQ